MGPALCARMPANIAGNSEWMCPCRALASSARPTARRRTTPTQAVWNHLQAEQPRSLCLLDGGALPPGAAATLLRVAAANGSQHAAARAASGSHSGGAGGSSSSGAAELGDVLAVGTASGSVLLLDADRGGEVLLELPAFRRVRAHCASELRCARIARRTLVLTAGGAEVACMSTPVPLLFGPAAGWRPSALSRRTHQRARSRPPAPAAR